MTNTTEALRRIDAGEDVMTVQDELLAVAEDFVHYVARRGKGITMATPARRQLRIEVEHCILRFMQSETGPTAIEERVDAKLEEIRRQQTEFFEEMRRQTPTTAAIEKLSPARLNRQEGGESWLENESVTAKDTSD